MVKNIWLDGMMGLATGDALGNPVQFMSREHVRRRGNVEAMEAGGAFQTPAGTWTDDSSMAFAALDSIREIGAVVPEDIMLNFVKWYFYGEYTPFGEAFDIGNTCSEAIERFTRNPNWRDCGKTGEHANGNGALMRIMPICIHYIDRQMNGENISDDEAITAIHQVTALTHNHLRAKIASGLYFYMAREVSISEGGDLRTRMQRGINKGFAYYKKDIRNLTELSRFNRIHNLHGFMEEKEETIRSTGYVMDTIEAAVWSLITTSTYRDCLIRAVNLGDDADTVGAVAGGLAGLYYGYDNIPSGWLNALQRRDWLEEMCTGSFASEYPVVDIHAHLIPGIDDGSCNLDMTMQMIQSEYRQGVRAIICTPHADRLAYGDLLSKEFAEIRQRCAQEYSDLFVSLGCEIFLSLENVSECLYCLEKGIIPSLNQTKYVLVEFSQQGIPFEEIQTCVRSVLGAGWIPVIAHAERYGKSYRGMEDVRWLKENGCRLQINLYSVKDDISHERRTLTRQMIVEKLVDYVGTDTHRMTHRPPRIANGVKELLMMADEYYVKQITYENARRDLNM